MGGKDGIVLSSSDEKERTGKYIINLVEELNKWGLNAEQYEACLKDAADKVQNFTDMDWAEIVEKYHLNMHPDTLRKAQQTSFGGAFVSEYFKQKNLGASTQLEEAKELIGEQLLLKKQLQSERTRIQRFKNDFTRAIAVADDVKAYFLDAGLQVNIPEAPCALVENADHEMLVIISDWHIGYVIKNCKGNYYNYDIARERLDVFVQQIQKYAKLYSIRKVYVMNLGDTIESTYMRRTQSQHCEFYQGEQIAKATLLIFEFLTQLSQGMLVEYDGVAGNHDRFASDKSENLDGDNANSTIAPLLAELVNLSNNSRIHIVMRDYADTEIKKTIQGLRCKFVHGDKSTRDERSKIKNEISMDNELFDLYFEGHWHNFRCISENRGRYLITTGCLSGYNNYSTQFGCATNASQTLCILRDGSIELIKDVPLSGTKEDCQ